MFLAKERFNEGIHLTHMEVIRGTAVSVRYTVHVSGDKEGVSTRHHAIFKVGKTTILFDSGAPPVISEGDRLVVAGRMKGKSVMLADAYRNNSVGVRGDSGLWLNFAGMLFGFVLGVAGFSGWMLSQIGYGRPGLDETLDTVFAVKQFLSPGRTASRS